MPMMFLHSDIGDRRSGLYPENITYRRLKQRKESSKKYIENAATTEPPKKKQLSLLIEDRSRVRFSTIVKTALLEDVPLASQMTDTEKNTLWWCEGETVIAEQCIATICDTTRCRPNYGDSSSSYISVLGRIYDQCHDYRSTNSSPVDENDQKLLSQWARKSYLRRGLETRVIESTIEEKRGNARETLVYVVQSLHKNEKIDDRIKAEVIRMCSERISRGARHFAQSLAQADVESIKPRPKLPRRRCVNLPKKLLPDYYVGFGLNLPIHACVNSTC
jgi:hypothetical protein